MRRGNPLHSVRIMPLAHQYALGLDVNALFPTVGLPQQADGAVTADIHGTLRVRRGLMRSEAEQQTPYEGQSE